MPKEASGCCGPSVNFERDFIGMLKKIDINEFAGSYKIYAVKPLAP